MDIARGCICPAQGQLRSAREHRACRLGHAALCVPSAAAHDPARPLRTGRLARNDNMDAQALEDMAGAGEIDCCTDVRSRDLSDRAMAKPSVCPSWPYVVRATPVPEFGRPCADRFYWARAVAVSL